jgi:hypothetical protein
VTARLVVRNHPVEDQARRPEQLRKAPLEREQRLVCAIPRGPVIPEREVRMRCAQPRNVVVPVRDAPAHRVRAADDQHVGRCPRGAPCVATAVGEHGDLLSTEDVVLPGLEPPAERVVQFEDGRRVGHRARDEPGKRQPLRAAVSLAERDADEHRNRHQQKSPNHCHRISVIAHSRRDCPA